MSIFAISSSAKQQNWFSNNFFYDRLLFNISLGLMDRNSEISHRFSLGFVYLSLENTLCSFRHHHHQLENCLLCVIFRISWKIFCYICYICYISHQLEYFCYVCYMCYIAPTTTLVSVIPIVKRTAAIQVLDSIWFHFGFLVLPRENQKKPKQAPLWFWVSSSHSKLWFFWFFWYPYTLLGLSLWFLFGFFGFPIGNQCGCPELCVCVFISF